jgi:antitoxin component YwqK of YwqJK toxin-antitoxin module
VSSSWYPDGGKKEEIDRTVGSSPNLTSWYANGQMKKKQEYVYQNKEQLFRETEWYENGMVKLERSHKGNDSNPRDLLDTEWYENGQIKTMIVDYMDSYRKGKMIHWHENGQMSHEATVN